MKCTDSDDAPDSAHGRPAGEECVHCERYLEDAAKWIIPVIAVVLLIIWYFISWRPLFAKPPDTSKPTTPGAVSKV